MEAQQLSVKAFSTDDSNVDQDLLIPIFHRWIREARLGDKLLIDVADYRHVPDGPGMMIIADHAHYGYDEGLGGGPGFLFTRKRDAIGDVGPKLDEAIEECVTAAKALQGEPTLGGKLTVRTDKLLVRVMSRLVAPNNVNTFNSFEPHLRAALKRAYPGVQITLTHQDDPRAPFGVLVELS